MLTLHTTYINEAGKTVTQILIEKADTIYNRVATMLKTNNYIGIKVYDNNTLIFSK